MSRAAPANLAGTEQAQVAVESNPLWYHTIEVAPGVVTPGWFDLRPIVSRIPFPDLAGKRCLDVGTYDGFLAFELERRGASEVVATDIADHRDWDWPARLRARGHRALATIAGPEKGLGFRIAREALGSGVRREEISVYDLSPQRIGEFDVVVCGTLLLHLRDPVRALEAIHGVCRERLVSIEEIRVGLTLRGRGRPLAELDGTSELCQWWVPNRAGHAQLLRAAGFRVERSPRPLSIPFGPAHPPLPRLPRRPAQRLARRLVAGPPGIPCSALLARPELR